MNLLPTEEEVLKLLRDCGALRTGGSFEYQGGLHGDVFLQTAIAMKNFQTAKTLSVALSRKLRQNTELRAMISNLSVVTPEGGGVAVAYGIAEALRVKEVFWTEEDGTGMPHHFREFIEPKPGDKVLLVDDILRSGRKLTHLKKVVEGYGAEVVGLAVLVYQPTPNTPAFEDIPLYYLARLEGHYSRD